MPDFIPAWLSNLLGKESTVKIMFAIVLFLALVTFVSQDSFKDHPMPSLAFYPGMFAAGFLISHFISFSFGALKAKLGKVFKKISKGITERNKAKEIEVLFNSFTDEEIGVIAMAIDIGERYIVLKRGHPEGVSLVKKGLIEHWHPNPWEDGTDCFFIKSEYIKECYIRYAGYFNE
ncbi:MULTISPECIES: hypothetical protein [unclassified Tatumella]|uniref:hypothetical protein n=1 Tax=unclassified Tatumella TaxID=2649542 RepID=UPI001BAED666|nr:MULTISPECIES: hypothetical protein [unclassified Tatumella]MBS0857267.1 hypothetical protein [Tatumella sp. JGM16]